MNRKELEAEMQRLCRESHGDGMRLAAQMARDMADSMLDGRMPTVGGVAALQLFAAMADRVLVERDKLPFAEREV